MVGDVQVEWYRKGRTGRTLPRWREHGNEGVCLGRAGPLCYHEGSGRACSDGEQRRERSLREEAESEGAGRWQEGCESPGAGGQAGAQMQKWVM